MDTAFRATMVDLARVANEAKEGLDRVSGELIGRDEMNRFAVLTAARYALDGSRSAMQALKWLALSLGELEVREALPEAGVTLNRGEPTDGEIAEAAFEAAMGDVMGVPAALRLGEMPAAVPEEAGEALDRALVAHRDARDRLAILDEVS